MSKRLHILHLEDDPADAELVEVALAGEGIGCEMRVVATHAAFVAALQEGEIDLVLADFALPAFDGMSALAIVRSSHPDLPFVFVSGRLGEEAAIESLKSGATDYVLKNRLARLGPAVKRALAEAAERAELRQTEEALARANREIQERAEGYQNLFNSIRDVIVVTDHERTILHVNQPALRELFGYELDEVTGRDVRILYAAEDDYRRTAREIFDLREPIKGKILEIDCRRKNGEVFNGELYALKRLDSRGVATGNIGIVRDISERKKTQAALRESELHRYQLQLELVYAAEVQAKLLPRSYPHIPGFDVAAQCLPARQVGGDFFDWQEVCPGVWSFTLGDVMGKGMAAAMLMATVRAALRSVAHNRPETAVRLAEQALLPDLENSESFVTLFHAQLDTAARRLTFVDCGHGYAFLRRNDGRVEDFAPRGLPLGVTSTDSLLEGTALLETGDVLLLYSDGLVDARPELALGNHSLAACLSGAASAQEMVGRLIGLTEQQGPVPDDITILVVRCTT
ncbi:MAG: diguanylate cyclase [Desulfuromonadales bacterium GWD2_61_12]|nr:MAG: diguanylate cyclase [Desulfuromonadales bacterium GWC2_61_20]OGR36473.1 MAG: diguanylate cyclase [Desulfuromonadales bacterium GWD2_61_12]HAD03799.1 diguanylate cyclase [Desulfuromonas sp.]HBT82735.1 diguanylate cyclase [Desulfuromonas sp.]